MLDGGSRRPQLIIEIALQLGHRKNCPATGLDGADLPLLDQVQEEGAADAEAGGGLQDTDSQLQGWVDELDGFGRRGRGGKWATGSHGKGFQRGAEPARDWG